MATSAYPTAALAYFQIGDWPEVETILDDVQPLALRHGYANNWTNLELTRALVYGSKRGQFFGERARTLLRRHAAKPGQAASAFFTLGENDYYLGRWTDAVEHFEEGLRRSPQHQACWCGLISLRSRMGDHEAVDRMLAEWGYETRLKEALALQRVAYWNCLITAADALFTIERYEHAARLYPLLRKRLERGVMGGFGGRIVGIVVATSAAAANEWEEAELHFEATLALTEKLPLAVGQPETRFAWAHALRLRGRPQDRKRARDLLGDAAELYEKMRMVRHLAETRKLLSLV
jgi:tetratricopeptide (TPR) repeat protein